MKINQIINIFYTALECRFTVLPMWLNIIWQRCNPAVLCVVSCARVFVHARVFSIVRKILRRHFIAQWLSSCSVSFFLSLPPFAFPMEPLTHSVALWRLYRGTRVGKGEGGLPSHGWSGHTSFFSTIQRVGAVSKGQTTWTTSCLSKELSFFFTVFINPPTHIHLQSLSLFFPHFSLNTSEIPLGV